MGRFPFAFFHAVTPILRYPDTFFVGAEGSASTPSTRRDVPSCTSVERKSLVCCVNLFEDSERMLSHASAVPVLILAGGLATRLRPLTEKIPKALVEVAGRPFLDHQLELLRRQGVREVVLSVAYLGEMIKHQYGSGTASGVDIQYSFDGPKFLGTGGAIKKALPLLSDPFFVLYGDSYLPTDFQAVLAAFREAGNPALMTVFANADAWDNSNVWWEGGILKRYSKREKLPVMRHIDYGLSVCTKAVFKHYPESDPFDLAMVFEDLSRDGRLAGFEVTERFYEIGSHTGLAELDTWLRQRDGPVATRENGPD